METIERIFNRFVKIVENVVCIITGIMVVSVFINALLRYTLGKSLIWNEEFARYLFIWCCFLGGIVAHQRHQHLNVTIATDALPPKIQKIIGCISRIVTTGIVVFVFYSCLMFVRRTIDYNSTSLHIPLGVLNSVVSMMCLCMLVIDLYELVRFILKGQLQPATPHNEQNKEV
jgi:TRAP-type C4-dicarboxylate transport system permease small subunit